MRICDIFLVSGGVMMMTTKVIVAVVAWDVCD